MKVLETERLTLRYLEMSDAEFILGLLNEPSFHRYIGDKGVRTLDDAREYIRSGPRASYEENGFGLYCTEITADHTPIGICGLVKRPQLDDPDVGFAFLPAFWSRGYATEAAAAVLRYGREDLEIERIVAITSPDNDASARVLVKIGLGESTLTRLQDGDPVKLFTEGLPAEVR